MHTFEKVLKIAFQVCNEIYASISYVLGFDCLDCGITSIVT